MEIKEIKLIIDLMTKNGLSEFELEKKDFKIRVKKDSSEISPSNHKNYPEPGSDQLPPGYGQPFSPPPPSHDAPTSAESDLPVISSPMVGTFYRSPSPDSGHFVDVGSKVDENTVVCIIEAMKVMNEIKAETKGLIVEVLTENGKAVEFGKPLFRVKPD